MADTFQGAIRAQWAAILGWVIFGALLASLMLGHYVFDPFVFGFGYYCIYVTARLRIEFERNDRGLMQNRLLTVCLIALLYLIFAVRHNADKHEFVGSFERTCYGGRFADDSPEGRLCEEIQSNIDSTLMKESGSVDE